MADNGIFLRKRRPDTNPNACLNSSQYSQVLRVSHSRPKVHSMQTVCEPACQPTQPPLSVSVLIFLKAPFPACDIDRERKNFVLFKKNHCKNVILHLPSPCQVNNNDFFFKLLEVYLVYLTEYFTKTL